MVPGSSDFLSRSSSPNEAHYSLLLPVDILVKNMPKLDIDQFQYDEIKFGNQFYHNSNYITGQLLRAYYNNLFLGETTQNSNCLPRQMSYDNVLLKKWLDSNIV